MPLASEPILKIDHIFTQTIPIYHASCHQDMTTRTYDYFLGPSTRRSAMCFGLTGASLSTQTGRVTNRLLG